jgi:hypothetical protein
MLVLFWAGAVVSAYFGYRLYDWWVPAVVACAVVAGQLAALTAASGGPMVQLVGFGLMDLVMFHATFGIGRSLGQRRMRRRKGMR